MDPSEPSPDSAATRSRVNSFPSTDAASRIARSTGSRRSSRAASSAWIVGGTAIGVSSEEGPDWSPFRTPSSASIATTSSTKSGLPSATSRMRVAERPLSRAVQEMLEEGGGLRVGQRLEEDRGRVRSARAPRRPDVEQVGTGHGQEQQGRRAPSPSRAPAGP